METAKVDKVLCMFKAHSITKTNYFILELLLLQTAWE